MLHAGLARTDVTVFDPSMALLGWGVPSHRPERIGAPLHARALVLRDGAQAPPFALVVVDLCFVSTAIREAVARRMAERHASLGLCGRTMLAATHTHAGPNGISDHLYFALSAPGVAPETRETIVSGIVDALARAHAALAPVVASYSTAEVGLCEAAVFNRSWVAYSSNPEVEPVRADRRDEAVDRRVRVLALRDARGGALRGVVSWFALHGTSVHSDVPLVHPDHKGLAALDLERQLETEAPGVVAIFAQEAAGDVTPNYRLDPRRKLVVGRHDDDLDSAQHAADAQRRAVLRALAPDAPRRAVEGGVHVVSETIDMSCAEVDPELVGGREGVRTRSAVLGLAMAEGTAEGPGPLAPLAPIRRGVSHALRGAARPYVVPPLVELGRGRDGRVLGFGRVDGPVLRMLVGEVSGFLSEALRSYEGPFVPQRAPVQLARVGPLVIAALPCEPTTIAGRRVRRTVEAALARAGLRDAEVIVGAYANDYLGYLTTPEEHTHQHYEAACTFFGPHSLDAYRTRLARMAPRLAREDAS